VEKSGQGIPLGVRQTGRQTHTATRFCAIDGVQGLWSGVLFFCGGATVKKRTPDRRLFA